MRPDISEANLVSPSWSQAKAGGNMTYFTGKPCKSGHLAERYAKNGVCVVCMKDRSKTWEVENREQRKSLKRVWRKANPEKRVASERRHKEKYPEQYKAKDCVRSSKPERRLGNAQRSLKWRMANPEINRERIERWRRNNPEAVRASRQAARSRRKEAPGRFDASDIGRIRKQQKNRCAFYSDCAVTFSRSGFHVDHIHALAKGGSNWPRNIQLLCPNCNSRKSSTDPIIYAAKRGRLV